MKIPKTKLGIEAKRILQSRNPTHEERMFLVHYLRDGLKKTDYEVLWIIGDMNNWIDYNKERTWQQIISLTHFLKKPKYEGLPPKSDPKVYFRKESRGESFKKLVRFKGNVYNGHILKPYNKDFLFHAKKLKFGILKNGHEIYSPYPNDSSNPLVNTIYRSIEGIDHILLVIDIDREGNLQQAYKDLKLLLKQYPKHWTYIKFSGHKGFHAIRKIPLIDSEYDYGLLKEIGIKIENILGFRIDKKMFQPNRLIRSYSINFKSGLCSVPIYPDIDTLNDILLRAKTLELSFSGITGGD